MAKLLPKSHQDVHRDTSFLFLKKHTRDLNLRDGHNTIHVNQENQCVLFDIPKITNSTRIMQEPISFSSNSERQNSSLLTQQACTIIHTHPGERKKKLQICKNRHINKSNFFPFNKDQS